MYPVNQFIMGNDPIFNSIDDLDIQIQKMEAYKQKLKQLKDTQQVPVTNNKSIWREIDLEVSPMSDEQKNRLLQDKDYVDIYNELQSMVQIELLNLVKDKIENTERGRELLNNQLKVVKRLKTKIINDTNMEMELFKKFKDYSKSHPNASYDDFLKENL